MASDLPPASPTPPPPAADDPSSLEGAVAHGKKVSLDILHTMKTAQMQYGLRHEDYQRYRKYCTRRLTRIRKSLKFTHQIGAKGTSAFQKRPVEPHMVTDERYFLLVLFRCERAWAYAMQLKQDILEIQTANAPRLMHHHFRRLDKAAKYAQVLERISIRADEHTSLDATAYACHMQGIVSQERELWDDALTHLAKASTIYSKLGVISSNETKQLCEQKVEEINKRIHFCLREIRKSAGQGRAPEIKDEETKELIAKVLKGHEELTSKLESVVDASKKSAVVSTEHEVLWKGQRVGIQNEKLSSILLVNAQKLVTDIEADTNSTLETKLPMFEQLFGVYADAMKIIKEDTTTILKNVQNASKGKSKDPQEQALNTLQEYVNFLKLQASVQRSIVLADAASTTAITDITPVPTASKKKHPDDMVRLYDTVISGMKEIESLTQGTAQAVEDTKVLAARQILYKASRCYWLAQAYAAVQSSDKALALFDKASQQTAQANSAFATTPRVSTADRERLTRLEKAIVASRAKARARAFLATVEANEAGSKQSKSTPSDDKRLTDFPPNLEAIPCKPLLFDLALNDCTFPNLEARKRPQSQKPEQKEKSGGFFGFFRS